MKFYCLEPIGRKSYLLFDTFEETFREKGHEMVADIKLADIVLYDLWCGFGEYNKADVAGTMGLAIPVFVFDFHDYNDTTIWPGFKNWDHLLNQEWASNLRMFLDGGLVKAYFMRKMNCTLQYPEWVKPIECIQYPDHIFPLTTAEELSSRQNDIFFIGNTSRQRRSVCDQLSKHFKCDFVLGMDRIPHDEWLQRASQAKFFLTSDGGGLSDERPYQLIYKSVMLRQKNNHLQQHPFTNFNECMEVSEIPTEVEIANLKGILDSKWNLYHIYENGINHMMNYYSEKFRSLYILDTIAKHL